VTNYITGTRFACTSEAELASREREEQEIIGREPGTIVPGEAKRQLIPDAMLVQHSHVDTRTLE